MRTAIRTIKRRRMTMTCIICDRPFRYLYPGTGPYRNICHRKDCSR